MHAVKAAEYKQVNCVANIVSPHLKYRVQEVEDSRLRVNALVDREISHLFLLRGIVTTQVLFEDQ